MKRVKATILAGIVVTFGLIGVVVSQHPEKDKPAPAAGALDSKGSPKTDDAVMMEQMETMMPKPDKEHEGLKNLVGTWDSEVEFSMGPGMDPMKSKSSETVRMMGDFWAIGDTTGDMMGQPFYGHTIYGYDPMKKKHIVTWVDSTGPSLLVAEGTYDDAHKVLTTVGEGPDMSMTALTTYTMKSWFEGDDKRMGEMWVPGRDKQPVKIMTITLRRRK